MEFCPKCGSILIQKTKNAGCARCGYSAKGKLKIKTSEKVDEKNEIAVIKKKEETHPIVNSDCKNCGHDKAYFWTVQTRSSDEAETKFFKCVKCGETSRDYS